MTSRAKSPDAPVLVIVMIAAGIGLRLWQYLSNASLWLDEAALARNIVDRSAFALVAPLDYGQTAPPAFLLVEKCAVAVLGNHEFALRLFPLICGIASVILIYLAAREMLGRVGTLLAVSMLCAGIPFVFFSSQVKPYSGDVAAALLLLILGLGMRHSQVTARAALVAGLVGAALPWFSYTAMFVAAGVGVALLASAFARDAGIPARRLSVTLGLWAASTLIAALTTWHLLSGSDREFMHRFWTSGFGPFPPRTLADLVWPWRRVVAAFDVFSAAPVLLDGGLHYRWPLLFASLSLAGGWSLWRRSPTFALLVFLPILTALAGAEAHLYPFAGRVAMFVLPFLLLAVAASLEDLQRLAASLTGAARFVVPAVAGLVILQPIVRNPPPDRREDMKTVLRYVREHRERGDAMYVYYGAGQSFLYYAPRFGIHPSDYVVGSCSPHEPRAYLQELDRLRGLRRVWTIFSHSLRGGGEIRLLTAYLDHIGRRLHQVPDPSGALGGGAYAFLYDLSDRRMLATTSATSYAMAADSLDNGWICYGTLTPVARPAEAGREAAQRLGDSQ
jgi:hypothetical protein